MAQNLNKAPYLNGEARIFAFCGMNPIEIRLMIILQQSTLSLLSEYIETAQTRLQEHAKPLNKQTVQDAMIICEALKKDIKRLREQSGLNEGLN